VAEATSVSLSKLTAAVQAAVKAAVAKHPKFKIDPPAQVALSYLIRGFPVPELLLANATLAETQAFAADVAAHLGANGPAGFAAGHAAAAPEAAVFSHGRHIIIGIPAVTDLLLEK
jgi:hypothetical protein